MDHDKLNEEVQRLQDWLSTHDETDPNYDSVLARLTKLTDTGMKYDELCDKQLERQDRLELDRSKQAKEFELKAEELEFKRNESKEKLEFERDKHEKEHELKEKELRGRFELERKKQDQEFELRREEIKLKYENEAKEIQLKYEMEERKAQENAAEVKARRKHEKIQAAVDLGKVILGGVVSGVLILVTSNVEQNVIIGQHKWAWIPKAGK